MTIAPVGNGPAAAFSESSSASSSTSAAAAETATGVSSSSSFSAAELAADVAFLDRVGFVVGFVAALFAGADAFFAGA